ncbi:MAG: DDE-type integrase/transposase/recombinase [Gammaproteobacteria bacterium]|nr:DDE-type integrase/transposase/recombinase [Gammaproteobacteria bacterium]
MVVPDAERDHLLWELHYSPLGGHLGMLKTLEKVQRHYYWPKLRQDVLSYLRSCIVCASRSGQGRHYKPPLQPIPVPAQPFVTLAMDIVKLCRTREGNLYALVTTDLFSKFVIVSAMPDMMAETVAKVWLRDILPFGPPAHVLSDQGSQFTSDLMKVVCDSLQIQQLFTTTFHPQCDGQTEWANQTLEGMLSKCSSVRGDDWDQVLPFVVHAYNSSVHASTKHSPYEVLFGRQPQLPSSSVFAVASNYFTLENDDDFKTMLPFYLQIAWEAVREESEKAKERQKVQYDKSAKVPPFEVGDNVFVQSK